MRIEYKYFLPRIYLPFFLNDLAPFVLPDDASDKAGGEYRVDSLYFETMNLKSYLEKIEGLERRVKLRLRCYPSDSNAQLVAEFKYKRGSFGMKRRCIVPYDSFSSFLAQPPYEKHIHREPDFADFNIWLQYFQFHPYLGISYSRKAFHAKADHSVRITVDSKFSANRYYGAINSSKISLPFLSDSSLILEVKTPGVFPFWLSALLQKYELRREAISKYVYALRHVALHQPLSVH